MEQAKQEEILQMLDQGMSTRAIAEEMGVSVNTIRDFAKGDGKAQGGAKASTTNAERQDQVAKAYESGMPVAKILETFQIGRPQLYAVLAKFEVPTRKITHEDSRKRAMDEAISMYQQGVVIRKITEDTGIHQPTLHAEIAKRGIPFRRPRAHRTQ
jgi:transposase